MTVTNLSAITGTLLKEYYLPSVIDQLNNSHTLYGRIEKSSDEIAGDSLQAQFLVKKSRNSGIQWQSESDNLPDATTIGYARSTIGLKYLYINAIHATSQALAAARKSASAFANLLDSQVQDATLAMEVELERALFGTGAGDLCQINETTGAIAINTDIGVDGPGTHALERGMLLEAYSATSGGTQQSPFDSTNARDYVTVSNIDRRNNKVQFDTASNVTNNYYLFRKGSRGKLMMGIKGITDHSVVSTLQGIVRSDGNQEWFRSTVINAASASLTLKLMQEYVEQGSIEGGGRCDLIVTSYELRRNYMGIFVSDRRYTPEDELSNGLTPVSYLSGERTIPILASRFCDTSYMYFLDMSSFKIFTLGGFDWVTSLDDEYSIVFRETSKDEYRAYMRFWGNLGCYAPNRNTVVQSLSTT